MRGDNLTALSGGVLEVEQTAATTSCTEPSSSHCHFYTASFPAAASCTNTTSSLSAPRLHADTARDYKAEGEKGLGRVPEKCIKNEADLLTFTTSKFYRELINFLTDLGNHVKGCPIQIDRKGSDAVQAVTALMGEVEQMTERFPPVQQAMRFGNKAFRPWYDAVGQWSSERLRKLLPEGMKGCSREIATYFSESFGNKTRIDYGTGHEFNFLCFLFCLCKVGHFSDADKTDIVLVVFKRYIDLMRTLQTVYVLEPAGSRGVWGLDDYHFLPFLWGAAQLQLQEDVTTEQVSDPAVVEEFHSLYLYVGAIKVILETKKGVPFGECSPLLNDITIVPCW
eukprot:GHVS01074608.1.p1 GENE.GHVS01074608.1~~GHVS01074608.1.p1  ORF type:complete len:338 (+),score=48.21 GHVS01074608.1:100-1113(+)